MIIAKNVRQVKLEKKHGGPLYRDLLCDDVLRAMWKFWRTNVPPKTAMDKHTHKDHEQIYFITKGSGVIFVGKEKKRVKAGDAIYLPPNISHGFLNDSNKPCVILCVGADLKKR
jgi:mannose-6-phosphate isomerase-like protein (cupin superfamily)